MTRHLSIIAALILEINAPAVWPRANRAELNRVFEKGAACVARDHDGRRFRDPYLKYAYPEERLPSIAIPGSPAPETPTYRMIDADMMLAMIADAVAPPESLIGPTKVARERLAAVVPLWLGRGLGNIRRGARVDGVALDTFCIVGWLAHDKEMARVVRDAIDGDGWLPVGFYDGEEAFRREADECWCLRTLAGFADDSATAAVRARIIGQFRSTAEADPGSLASFYRAFHLGLALGEDPSTDPALFDEITLALTRWAAAHPEDSLLEWVNLGSATFLRGESGRVLSRRAIRIVLERQAQDGCWRVPGMIPEDYGSTFLTLRALAALATELARSEPNPAP